MSERCSCHSIGIENHYNSSTRQLVPVEVTRCLGTKEQDVCDCGGDPLKCSFYEYIREQAQEKIEPEAKNCITTKLQVGDFVFTVRSVGWNTELKQPATYEIYKCIIRSISIFCNAKKEWKITYRAQRLTPDQVVMDIGLNFDESRLGVTVFDTYGAAQQECQRLRSELTIR